jgi:endoglucanase
MYDTVYEAEDQLVWEPERIFNDMTGASNGHYVKMRTSANNFIEWSNIDGGAGGVCVLNFMYALGKAGSRDCSVTVNGVDAGIVYFPYTSGWNNWEKSMLAVPCNAGLNNVIRLTSGSSGGPSVDYLQLTANPQPVIPGRYEAEYALQVGAKTYTTETSPNAVDVDAYVKMTTSAGDYIEWSNIDGGGGGTCTLNFRYALGNAGARDCSVTINGVNAGDISVLYTSGWNNWQITSLVVPCNAGSNNVVRVTGGSNGGPAFDYLEVIP